MKKFLLVFLLLFSFDSFAQKLFDIQGHRGARGLAPENTIPAFLKALEIGVDTLELDVVISADKKIVVSHEPFFSSVISLDKNGKPIPKDKENEHNIYKMKYSDIKLYDVGSTGNTMFPEQQKIKVFKPLLGDVFDAAQKYIGKNKLKQIKYNIEIKSDEKGDRLFHPLPAEFAKLVYDEIVKNKMERNVIVQSFDIRSLQEIRKFPVRLPVALLVENKESAEKNIEKLGFQPDIYSPRFSLIDEETIRYCREKNIKIIPWTVNEISDFETLEKLTLDGVITDYPDRAVKFFRNPKNE